MSDPAPTPQTPYFPRRLVPLVRWLIVIGAISFFANANSAKMAKILAHNSHRVQMNIIYGMVMEYHEQTGSYPAELHDLKSAAIANYNADLRPAANYEYYGANFNEQTPPKQIILSTHITLGGEEKWLATHKDGTTRWFTSKEKFRAALNNLQRE